MIRTRLQEITQNCDLLLHHELIELEHDKTQHSIEVLTSPNDNLRYNCVMFALGIETDPKYMAMAKHCPDDVHADTKFLQFLVDRGYLVESAHKNGVLIAYLDSGQFRHIGIVTDGNRVRSKWGIGHLYEHVLFEIPVSYGSTLRFFEPIERQVVLDAFVEFAELRGCHFGNSEI